MINWAAVAAVAAICGVLVTVIGVAFTSGKVMEKMKADVERVDGIEQVQRDHAVKLDDQHLRLDRLEQWRLGFQAAANVSGVVRSED